MIDLEHIRRRLAGHSPAILETPADPRERASVALILAGPPSDLSICFIHRATIDGDRWSGQMALPGGRGDVRDATTMDIAIRETEEEVGVVLPTASCIGALSHVRLRRRGLDARGILSPFIFALEGEPPPLLPNHEVNAAHWIPISYLWDPRNCTTLELEVYGEPLVFPGIQFNDEIIWGLTYRVLCLFADVVGRSLPCGVY